MEDTNLKDYNLSYEIQYIQLFVELLKPYIRFEYNPQFNGDKLKIYLMNHDKTEVQLEKKQFIYFIQLDFPRIINIRMSQLLEEEKNERNNYTEYINHTTGQYVLQKLEVLSREEMIAKKRYYTSGERKLIHSRYQTLPSEYELKLSELNQKKDTLNSISELNQKYHGKIKEIHHFLEMIENYYL